MYTVIIRLLEIGNNVANFQLLKQAAVIFASSGEMCRRTNMKMRKALWIVFGFGGWILAAWLYNAPTSPVEYRKEQFASFTEAMLNREGTPAHVIRWDKGVYARLESGAEIVHANYGPVSKAFDPPKDWCYNETILHENRISEHYCPSYGMSAGRNVDSFDDLPSAVQTVLLEGRRLAKEKWDL